jgi:hypothetical protein
MLEMGVVNEDSTYLLNLWDEGKVLDVQVPSQWDTTPFRIGVKEDYESVGLTLFIHLVQDEEKGGYIIPPFCHWESWYNHKCTKTSGMTKTDDRWATRKEAQPLPVVIARNSKEKQRPVV